MGLYLAAATLSQAALARGQTKQAAACWVASAAAFVGFLLIPGWDDRVVQVEVGYAARRRGSVRIVALGLPATGVESATGMATHIHTCPLCEATCGLRIETDNGDIKSIRGDEDDVFSRGFICPKAHGLKALHEDPDRLRHPLVRRDGELREASWAEAWQAVEDGLAPLLEQHGRNAVAVYLGNPSAHNLAANVYAPAFLKALGSQNIYSASTVDQMPKQVSAGLMFGAMLSVPVPDLDRCEHLVVLGANPLVSNGSLMTSPDARGRIRAIRERGGKVVVVDPRRSRTADEADEHHAIVPGTDAHFLFGIVHTLLEEGLADPGPVAQHCDGIEEVERLAADFAPERVAAHCGIEAGEIRRIARELAAAPRGACYGRIGTCTQEFGTLASWLVDVVNVLTGNLDREGGAMFTKAAGGQRNSSGAPGSGKGVKLGRWHSRVRGLPETFGELPVVCLAEEIETPGDGQVRALVTIAGNPVVSTPQSERLDRALSQLDFMVSLDIYVNETTRHADVILPGPSPLARSHYDLALYQLAVRNVANYSPAVMEPEPDLEPEWRQLLRLTAIVTGQGADADIDALDDFVLDALIQRAVSDPRRRSRGRTPPRSASSSATAAAPTGRSTSCSAPARTRSRSTSSRRTRTGSTSARSSRGSPKSCAPRRARSSSRPSRSSPTSIGCARRSSGAATATSC